MSPIPCFLVEDLRTARYRLRRYAGGSKCSQDSHGYHQAFSAPIEDRPDDRSKPYHGTNPPEVPRDDPRWPKACSCGYAFAETDTWQVFARGLYSRPETGEVFPWDDAPAGAICDAFWWPGKGTDGHAWIVKLPDRSDFMTEQKASNCACPADPAHRCWKRSGQVPKLTVSPSIATPRWHGWLRNGMLTEA